MQTKFVMTCGILFGLSACTSTGSLQPTQPGTKLSGSVTRGVVEPHRVEVSLDGKTYTGEWRTTAPTPEQKAATSYPHQKHIGQVRSTLKASDGDVLDCHWDTHGETAEGSCSSGDRSYPLILK